MVPHARLTALLLLGLLALLPASASANPIAAGEAQSCTITAAGAAVCWGARGAGSLGDGLDRPNTFDPSQVVGLTSGVTHITHTFTGGGSGGYGCAIVAAAAKCWGEGDSGKLGNGTTTNSFVPVDVVGFGSGVTDVSLNATHACGVKDGGAYCWGGSILGNGTNDQSSVPVPVSGMGDTVTQVATAWRSACALRGGAVSCWGNSIHGQLGSPGGIINSPRPVVGLGPATAIAGGVDAYCAIVGGGLKCWGSAGLLGNGATDASTMPVDVTGLGSGVTAITMNDGHACAIKDGVAYCWGEGSNGKLGNGGVATSKVPVRVAGLTNVTAIAVGRSHTCAIAGGVNYCWGSNSHGQLGNEAAGSQSTVPVPITGSLPAPVATPTPTVTPQPTATPKPRASISTLAGKRKVSKARKVTVATVACPAGASCTLSVPKTVKITIKRKKFTVKVAAARTLAGGKRLNVGLELPRAAYSRLKGRTASVTVKVTATAAGTSPTTLTVRATIRR